MCGWLVGQSIGWLIVGFVFVCFGGGGDGAGVIFVVVVVVCFVKSENT